jgi:hypothetical protein
MRFYLKIVLYLEIEAFAFSEKIKNLAMKTRNQISFFLFSFFRAFVINISHLAAALMGPALFLVEL